MNRRETNRNTEQSPMIQSSKMFFGDDFDNIIHWCGDDGSELLIVGLCSLLNFCLFCDSGILSTL